MDNWKLIPMDQLVGVTSNWNTPEIVNFYETQIYPHVNSIYKDGVSQLNEQIAYQAERTDQYSLNRIEDIKDQLGGLTINVDNIKITLDPNEMLVLLQTFNFILGWRQYETIFALIERIKLFFKTQGYDYRYFMFFKNDSYMYSININNTKLRFDIAQSGYSTPDFNNLSKLVFDQFSKFMRSKTHLSNFRKILPDSDFSLNYEMRTQGHNYVGWSRSELISALKESEFFEEHVDEITNSSGFIKYIYTYPKFNVSYKIRSKRELPIFEYVSRVKLELIYKYINNYNGINLHSLCKLKNIDNITLRRMLDKFDPSFLKGKYKELSVDEMCEALGTKAISASMLEIPQLSHDILYQPGGKYEKKIRKNYNEFMNIKEEEKTEIKEIYNKYLLNCADKNVSTQSIVFDAIELGLVDKIDRNMTRAEICEIIRKYIVQLYS